MEATKDSEPNTTPRRIPQFLLSPTLRLICLRLVIVSSSIYTGFAAFGVCQEKKNRDPSTIVALAIDSFTAVHHLGTALGPRLLPLPARIDIVITGLEVFFYLAIVGFIIHTSRQYAGVGGIGVEWFSKSELLFFVCGWILALSLLVLFFFKTLDLFSVKGSPAWRKLDIGKINSNPRWKYPLHTLFGRAMWKESIPGEPKWLIFARGLFTATFVCTLVAFGVYQVLLAPISEMGRVPYRHYRASEFGNQFRKVLSKVTWRVLFVLPAPLPDSFTDSASAVSVTGLRNLDEPIFSCGVSAADLKDRRVNGFGPRVVVATCPEDRQAQPNSDDDWLWKWYDAFPNFFVTVNHTALFGTTDFSPLIVTHVYLGAAADLEDVFSNTDPVSLLPGNHLLGFADIVLRQRLKRPQLATLGFETTKGFLVASVKQTRELPSSFARADETTSSLLFTLGFPGEWSILEDYRSKSVLAGLSVVGGLGSFLSTILAICVGTSLASAVLGIKPNSPFGFLHNLRKLQHKMVAKCNESYPLLQSDLDRMKATRNRGVLAYLLDTLIDLKALGYGVPGSLTLEQAGLRARSGQVAGPHAHDEEMPPPTEGAGGISLQSRGQLS